MGNRNFYATFESAPNDFAARKLRLGECGNIVINGKKYRVKPVKTNTNINVGDTVFCSVFGGYNMVIVASVDVGKCVVQKCDKTKEINCADLLGVCV